MVAQILLDTDSGSAGGGPTISVHANSARASPRGTGRSHCAVQPRHAMSDTAILSDTAIVGSEVDVVQTTPPTVTFSWSAAIAGTLAAIAVSFIIISLGSGIGLSVASPYRGPSVTTITVLGAVWLVMAQGFGFACGGFLSPRLRARFSDDIVLEDTKFRDGAQGFLVWALGVVITAIILASASSSAVGTAANATAGTAVATAALSNPQNPQGEVSSDPVGYFVDLLFRPASAGGAANARQASAQPLSPEARAEVTRIVARAVANGGLSEGDRTYLAQLVAQHPGISQDDARNTDVKNQARETEAADKAAKASAYFSFWMFMSLLFGAAAATLAGVLGGELRDDGRWLERALAPTIQPR
jgi:hypothetical protein